MVTIKPIDWVKNKIHDYHLEKIEEQNKICVSLRCRIEKKERKLKIVNMYKGRLEEELRLLKIQHDKIQKKIKPYIT